MYLRAIDCLSAAGLEHYEVSNFARPGPPLPAQRSRIGRASNTSPPAPARRATLAGVRETNHRSTTTYLQAACWPANRRSPSASSLSPEDRARELLVFALRRIAGVHRDWFAARSGFSLDELVAEPLRRYIALGMLEDTGRVIRLTREGLLVSDAIWPIF